MKVCEIAGKIVGFEYDCRHGFMFEGEWVSGQYPNYTDEQIKFPYNCNVPKLINLEKIRDKEFKVTIEIIEDDEQEKEEE